MLFKWSLVGLPGIMSAIHHLFTSNRNAPAAIHSVEFDDEENTLSLVKTTAADTTYAWLSFSHNKRNIYGSSLQASRVGSYRVLNATNVSLTRTIQPSAPCQGMTSAFNIGSVVAPYYVFAANYPGPNACGMSLAVDEDGALQGVASMWSYSTESAIHGMGIQYRDGNPIVYSADVETDTLWTHKIDTKTGMAEQLGNRSSPKAGMHPRHLTVHPRGTYAYVVMEAGNAIATVSLDGSGVAIQDVSIQSLIPEGEINSNFWSADAMLSPNSRYLWATARAQGRRSPTGYLSCFLLDEDGTITKRMFILPTGTSGTTSNAITTTPWSDEHAVLSDVPGGYVQVWKLADGKETNLGVEYQTARPVARLNVSQGCCTNAIWYD